MPDIYVCTICETVVTGFEMAFRKAGKYSNLIVYFFKIQYTFNLTDTCNKLV